MTRDLVYPFDGKFIYRAPSKPPSPEPAEQQPATLRPTLLTPEDAARYLSIGRSKMYQLLAGSSPTIPSLKVGGSRRIRVVDLDAYVEEQMRAEDGE